MHSTRKILTNTQSTPKDLFNYLMLDGTNAKLRHHKKSFLSKLLKNGGMSLLTQTLEYAKKALVAAEQHPFIITRYVEWGGAKFEESVPNAKVEPIKWIIAALDTILSPKNLVMLETEQKILASLVSPAPAVDNIANEDKHASPGLKK